MIHPQCGGDRDHGCVSAIYQQRLAAMQDARKCLLCSSTDTCREDRYPRPRPLRSRFPTHRLPPSDESLITTCPGHRFPTDYDRSTPNYDSDICSSHSSSKVSTDSTRDFLREDLTLSTLDLDCEEAMLHADVLRDVIMMRTCNDSGHKSFLCFPFGVVICPYCFESRLLLCE